MYSLEICCLDDSSIQRNYTNNVQIYGKYIYVTVKYFGNYAGDMCELFKSLGIYVYFGYR